MKNMISLLIINILIVLFLVLSFWNKIFFIPLSILLILNIAVIYIKSLTLDKNEQKKKIVLHKVKNSLSVILGYSEAHNEGIISKNEMDEKINEEIAEIVTIIKEEIYKQISSLFMKISSFCFFSSFCPCFSREKYN